MSKNEKDNVFNGWSSDLMQQCSKKINISFLKDNKNIAEITKDFGGILTGASSARLLPKTALECKELINFANNNNLKFVIRAKGFSQGGQTLGSKGTVTLDCSEMTDIDNPNLENMIIRCQPGATWRSIAAVTAQYDLIPKVIPFFPDLTVGGVISIGGIGGNSHINGCISGNIYEIEVITGAGDFVKCNSQHNQELFNATLCGLGRCSFITSVTLNLRKFKQKVKTFYLSYLNHETWIEDQKYFTQISTDYLEAFCLPLTLGLQPSDNSWSAFNHWLYIIQVSIEYDEEEPDESVLKDHQAQQIIKTYNSKTISFLNRYGIRAQNIKDSGQWQLIHPWWECILPIDKFSKILPELLEQVPKFINDGLVYRTFILNKNCPPSFIKADNEFSIGIAILPKGVDLNKSSQIIDIYQKIDEWLSTMGGKRYLSGWLERSLNKDWQQHYESYYNVWKDAKLKYDPNNVFQSILLEKEHNTEI